MKRLKYFLPLILLIVSVFFRFYKLGNIPQAFHFDEAGLGYNAWSILKTGKDEWGKKFPLTLQSFGDYKPAIYSYLTIPFVAMMGLTQVAVRMPAIIIGSLLPLVFYLLLKKWTKNDLLSFWSGLVITIAPWHIEISRTAIEAGVAVFMLVLVLWLFEKNKKWANWTGLFMVLISLFTYHTARMVVAPILLLAMGFSLIKTNKLRLWGTIFLLLFGMTLSLTASESRFDQISIFNDKGAILSREEAIREDGTVMSNIFKTRVFHNKLVSLIWSFSESLLTNISLTYLFLGGAQPPRVNIPETGQFQLMFLPFFLLGLVSMVRGFKKIDKFMFLWLLIAAIPVSLTYAEIPHTYRTLFMLPPLAFIISSGIVFSWSMIKKNLKKFSVILGVVFALALLINTAKSWHQYIVHQQNHHPWYRQYGYKELIDYLNNNHVSSKKITFTNMEGEPYIFMLFYNQIEPNFYQSSDEKRLTESEIISGKISWSFDKYVFVDEECPYDPLDDNPENIYVVYKTCSVPCGYERLHTINYQDNTPEFHIDSPISKQEYEEYLSSQNDLVKNGIILPKDIVDCRNDRI